MKKIKSAAMISRQVKQSIRRRFSPYKTYDKLRGKTPGLVYAPHNPEVAELIDMLEFARCLRKTRPAMVATLIVGMYYKYLRSFKPNRSRRQTYTVDLPDWPRLPHECKALLYATASVEAELPLSHALTFHLEDEALMVAEMRGKGVPHVVGDFINSALEPIYRRAGHKLRYIYVVETERLFDRDDAGDRMHLRSSLHSFHVSLLLRIPEDIDHKVRKGIARWARMSSTQLGQYKSGQAAHLARLDDSRTFSLGESATARGGIIGRVDYAAKGFRKLYLFDELRRLNSNPNPYLQRWSFASDDIRTAARELYAELIAMLQSDPRETIGRILSAPLPDPVEEADMVERGAALPEWDTADRIAACMLRTTSGRKLSLSVPWEYLGVTSDVVHWRRTGHLRRRLYPL